MVLALGVMSALLAASLIGTGQTIQKYAISNLNSAVDTQEHASKSKQKQQSQSRVSSPTWLLGIGLTYLGEVFNGLALGQASAAVVTPLNIVSVLVSGVLGCIFLGETLSRSQRYGYACIIAGVGLILVVSPQGGSTLGQSPDEILKSLSSFMFLTGFSSVFLVQTVLIYNAMFRRTTIMLLTCICSLFGAIVVIGSKVVSSLLQTAATSNKPLSATPDAIPALFIMGIMIVGSIVIQEFFKQEALTRFSMTKFQPIFFAGFNTAAVLSSVVLFREFSTWQGLGGFLCVFAVAISVILAGSKLIQGAGEERGELIKDHK
ncbi:NIPA-like protein 2 [Chytriomyces hyalinus]|nr:NIPA-like protein 2 [Chytriomyces hyalinus]